MNGNFTKHRRIYTAENPYQYDIWDKSFSVSESLKKHINGVIPYILLYDVCVKAYIHSKWFT